MAAKHIPDGVRVLEIGTGTGQFRSLVKDRCLYTGADLRPLDDETRALDIERDPVPTGAWDVIVLLGVVEYLHNPIAALGKVCATARGVVLSYCVPRPGQQPLRFRRGWMNALTEQDLMDAMGAGGLGLKAREDLEACDEFDQRIFVFERQSVAPAVAQRGS